VVKKVRPQHLGEAGALGSSARGDGEVDWRVAGGYRCPPWCSRWARILRVTAGSWMNATTRIGEPQWRQVRSRLRRRGGAVAPTAGAGGGAGPSRPLRCRRRQGRLARRQVQTCSTAPASQSLQRAPLRRPAAPWLTWRGRYRTSPLAASSSIRSTATGERNKYRPRRSIAAVSTRSR
jgi:hypothetical protein